MWIERENACAIRSGELAAPRNGEVLVRNEYSGISRGTEATVLQGRVPASEYARMRGPNMEGDFPFPVKYGYASVGTVESGPDDIKGRKVFCLHPHQDRFVVGAEQVHPLPSELPPERAVLAANMETALNIVWDANIQPGDKVAVFGAGVVGSLVANISSRIAGTDTVIVDNNPRRRRHVEALGLSFAEPNDLGGEFDILINASASPEALTTAISCAAFEAKIVEASWYGDRNATIPLGGAFHSRRLSIVSSQVGSVPADRSHRWSFRRRMSKALELLLDPRLDNLISGETKFTDLPEDYPRILNDQDTLCHRVYYP
ncbi:zinc-binding alcohol dehydrogenase [Agrobacterium larrymoorei]|nr:zinc-binding alcohol dehydrogenase [Agrobacterium larrymoorei]